MDELLIAYPVFGAQKTRRLLDLAERAHLIVTTDSLDTARPLSEAARERGLTQDVLLRWRPAIDAWGWNQMRRWRRRGGSRICPASGCAG